MGQSVNGSGVPALHAAGGSLEALLERETADLHALINVLEDELDALASGTARQIEDCAQAKQHLIRRIFAARDAVNAAARGQPGFGPGSTAEAWLARHSSPRVREAFETLTGLAGHARELNQLAARVVHNRLSGVNERLDVLLPPGFAPNLYAKGGTVDGRALNKGIIGRA